MDETSKHTVNFDKSQLEVLVTVAKAILADKIFLLDDLNYEQQGVLVETRNLIQKSLDFPDLKF